MATKVENLTKARAALVIDHPFFASLLLQMPMIEDTSIKTMATNGEWIRYNPAFVNGMTLQETTFVLAHEVMHCVFQHMYRRGARNHNKWNIAGDYVINDLLAKERVGVMPKDCLHNPQLVQSGNGTTEGVYGLLPPEDEQKQAGDQGNGGSMDDVQDGAKDDAEQAQKESEMKVKVVQAANAAKMAGKLSGNLERMVKEMTRTKTDWRAVLRRFLSERAKTDWTYAKPKRRFLAEDIYLPGLTGEKLGKIVVAVDCSGSITDELLNTFGAEIRAIIQDVVPEQTHVVYFDSEVLKTECFTPDDDVKLKPVGGGGTAFSPIWKEIADQNIDPAACVVLTDLECYDFGDAPEYPVLWASIGREEAPFGETVLIKE